MIRVPMPTDHNDTDERYARRMDYGFIEPIRPIPKLRDSALLIAGLVGSAAGVVALVMRVFGYI